MLYLPCLLSVFVSSILNQYIKISFVQRNNVECHERKRIGLKLKTVFNRLEVKNL